MKLKYIEDIIKEALEVCIILIKIQSWTYMRTTQKSKDMRLNLSKHPLNIWHTPFILTSIMGLPNQIDHT